MALNALGLGLEIGWKDHGAVAGLKQLGDEYKSTSGMMEKGSIDMDAALKTIGGEWQRVGQLGLTGLAALHPTIAAATEFGFEIAKIRTVIDEANFSTQALRDTTMGLAASFGLDALQEANALYETISAGVTDAAKATDLVGVANQFAVGGTTGLAGAIDVLTSAVNTYADQGLTAQRASDLMFTAIAAGKTTAEQLSASLGEVAPTAHAAGVGFDELQAAIAALTVQGIKTPQAMTAINAMLSNMMKPTADAEKEAKRLGIQFNATALKTMGLRGVLMQLVGNTKVNNDTFTQLFGSVEGVKGALTLTAGGGAKLTEILTQMENASGATGKAFEIMANTTKFQGDRFKALGKNALILIGEVLEPLAAKVMSLANRFLEAFTKLDKPVRTFLVYGFAITSTVIAIVGSVMSARAGIAVLSNSLAAAGTSFGAMAASAGWVILAIAAVALAVYGLKAAIDRNLGGIGDLFHTIVAKVSLGFQALSQLFSQGGFSGAVRAEFQKAENDGVRGFAIQVFLWVSRIANFFSSLVTSFSDTVDKAAPVFTRFVVSLERIGAAFGSAVDGPKKAGSAFDTFGRVGGRAGTVIADALVYVVDMLTNVINYWAGVKSSISSSEFVRPLSAAFTLLGESISTIMTALGSLGGSFSATGTKAFSIGQFIGGVLVFAIRNAANVVQTLAAVLANLATVFSGAMNLIVGLLTGDWSRAWLGAKQIVFGVVSGIVETFGSLIQFVANGLDMLSKLGGNTTHYAQDVADWRTSTREGLASAFGVDQAGQAAATAAPTPVTAQSAVSAVPTAVAGGLSNGGNTTFSPAAMGEAFAAAVGRSQKGTTTVQVILDGQVLAAGMSSVNDENASRNFSPQTPEG